MCWKKPSKKDLDFILSALTHFVLIQCEIICKEEGLSSLHHDSASFPAKKHVSKCRLVRPVSFHLDGVSHLPQMSFILFCDNDKYCRYIAGRSKEDLKGVLCVDSV